MNKKNMENMDRKVCTGCMCGGSCAGGNCGCMQGGMGMHEWHGGKHFLLRALLKLIIIMLIFFFGFHLGQLTGYIKASYGGYGLGKGNSWGMTRGNNSMYGNMMQNSQGMMQPATP